jgi:hypothetical protein
VMYRVAEMDLIDQPVFNSDPVSERICPWVKEKLGQVPAVGDCEADRVRGFESLFSKLADAGKFEIYRGYSMRLVRVAEGDQVDTPDQRFYWEVSWQVKDISEAQKAWNSSSLVGKLSAEQQERFFDEINRQLANGWMRPKEADGGVRAALKITTFPHVNEGKNTKVRPVNDCKRANEVSPPATNSQLATVEAVRILRGALKQGFVVHQRDLDQAFMRVRVAITDAQGNRLELELRPPGAEYLSDRLVFGLAIGPLALTSALAATRVVVEVVVPEAEAVAVIPVMDDSLFVGDEARVEVTEAASLEAWSMTGFAATKHWTWSGSEPTKWLGHYWRWNPEEGRLLLNRAAVEGNLFDATKRNVYALAGSVQAITESFSESMAIGHANVARKLAGKSESWDGPMDVDAARGATFHLEEMQRMWELAKEEGVALTSGTKTLLLETDASLSGQAFVLIDGEPRLVVGSGSRLAGETMNLERWGANRRELHAVLTGACKVAQRLKCFPQLKHVALFTDSRVAVSHLGEFRDSADPDTPEGFPLIRMSAGINRILNDFGKRGICVEVNHIAGVQNGRADALSRVAESGGFKEVVFRRREQGKPQQVQVNFISVMAERVAMPVSDLLGMPTIGRKYKLYLLFRRWRREPVEHSDLMLLRFVKVAQCQDSVVNHKIIALSKGNANGSENFELVNGALVFRPPVTKAFFTEDLSGETRKVVLPRNLAREHVAALHVQLGHVGEKALLMKVRTSVHVMDSKVTDMIKEVCESCEGCSRTKPGREHRTAYGPITFPAGKGDIIGIDITGGASVTREAPPNDSRPKWTNGLLQAPCVLSVTDKQTGFTKLKALKGLSAEEVGETAKQMLHDMGILGCVREVWTDNGKQFVSKHFKKVLMLAAEGAVHRTIPMYAPYAGGWYEVQHRALNQVMRAVLAEVDYPEWQDVCNLAERKINYAAPDGAPSPYMLWYGRIPMVEADRLVTSVLRPHRVDLTAIDNSSAAVVKGVMDEYNAQHARLKHLDAIFEDMFTAKREAEAASFRTRRILVGDRVRTLVEVYKLRGKLDCKWSEEKVVESIRGNVVRVVGESRDYHAWQVKVIPSEGEPEQEETLEVSDSESDEAESEIEQGADADEELKRSPGEGRKRKRELTESARHIKRRKPDGEATFLQSLLHDRGQGKRRPKPSAKVREVGA